MILKTGELECQWYALYTKSRAEKRVVEQLTKMGIKAYLPLKRELKQWSDRKKWVETPVISSYVFINIPRSEYSTVFRIQGVVAYVSYKGKAVEISDDEIESMRAAVNSSLNVRVTTGEIKKGETITIASGPLKGVTGDVTEVRGKKKLYLRLGNIGYTLVVDLDGISF